MDKLKLIQIEILGGPTVNQLRVGKIVEPILSQR